MGDLLIVGRPGEPGRALCADLAARGADVLWLPAFEITGPPDPAAVERVVATLPDYRLVVFVSPTAVQAFAAHLHGRWPGGTAVAGVGEGTARHARERLHLGPDVTVHAPAPAGSGGLSRRPSQDQPPADAAASEPPQADGPAAGSEALWATLQAHDWRASRVLIVRAAAGREWLGERLRAVGAQVDELAAYDRRPLALSSDQVAALGAAARAQRRGAMVVPSSDAVAAFDAAWRAAGVIDWARAAVALAPHPRIAERLVAAGYRDVRMTGWSADAILRAAAGGGATGQ